MYVKAKRKRTFAVVSIVVAAILALLVVEAFIEVSGNERNAQNNSQMVINQIIGNIKQNEKDAASMIESLKADYIVRAQAISYMLENNAEAENDLRELIRIAELMSVDEIHLFDESGTIYGGSVPKYYGLKIDAGEQISFFKPMLEDKTLSMCQDVSPNTAENKAMMYAMVWDKAGTKMIQVGINSEHLLNDIRGSMLSDISEGILTINDLDIFVANSETRTILDSTNLNAVGSTLGSIGYSTLDIPEENAVFTTAKISGVKSYCSAQIYGDSIILVSQSITAVNHGLMTSLLIVLVYLCIAMGVGVPMVIKMSEKANREREQRIEEQEKSVECLKNQMAIIEAVSTELTDIVLVEPENHLASMVKVSGKLLDISPDREIKWNDYDTTWANHIDRFAMVQDSAELRRLSQIDNVLKGIKENGEYSFRYRMVYRGKLYNYQVKYVPVSAYGKSNMIVSSFQNINHIIEAEQEHFNLERKANTDELTGLYNRTSYEEAIHEPSLPGRVYSIVAMDVNGLKNMNDNYGHEAGDELLRGAAICMKRCLGRLGKIFRTGGDEFFAIIEADDETVSAMLSDFSDELSAWSGDIVKQVSVAYGAASNREFPNMTAAEIAKAADARMYKDKQRHYSQSGVDRRSRQQSTFTTLCKTYLEALQANLTTDSYRSMLTDENGRLSAKLGEIPSKLSDIEYLRERIGEDNALRFSFTMPVGGEEKRVLLEIVKTPDYSDENMNVFVLIKEIGE